MTSKRTFLDTIYFLYIVGKCFGLSCYGVSKGPTKYKALFEMANFFQLAAFSAAFTTLIYFNLQLKLNNDTSNTRIFNQAQQILITLSLLFLMGGIVQVLFMRNRFWNIANTLTQIDSQMIKLLKIEINYNNLYRYTLIHTFNCYLALVVLYTFFGYYSFVINRGGRLIAQYVSYVMINGAFALLTIQFQVFMYSMYMRFSALNQFVESNILSQTHQLELPFSTSIKLQAKLFSIAKITDQLNSLVPRLSLYFLTFGVSAMLGVFCLTVFNFHNLFRLISEENTFEFYLVVTIYQMIGFIFSILTGFNIAISTKNTDAAKKMGTLVHKVIARTHNQQFILKLKILSLQILHRSPDFSFGVFTLNWQLSFSYVASVASYLFILIQFQMHIADEH